MAKNEVKVAKNGTSTLCGSRAKKMHENYKKLFKISDESSADAHQGHDFCRPCW